VRLAVTASIDKMVAIKPANLDFGAAAAAAGRGMTALRCLQRGWLQPG
jgi:NADPH:quinone reductase-like Zn-dependent oxidoreductase